MTENTVTCSFEVDRDLYDAFKSIVYRNGESVKENLIKYMQAVVDNDNSNKNVVKTGN